MANFFKVLFKVLLVIILFPIALVIGCVTVQNKHRWCPKHQWERANVVKRRYKIFIKIKKNRVSIWKIRNQKLNFLMIENLMN